MLKKALRTRFSESVADILENWRGSNSGHERMMFRRLDWKEV
jgi:hypothetical protein